MLLWPALLQLMLVHGPHGQEIHINVEDISSIRQVREGTYGHFSPDVRCLIFMDGGRFIATTETCLRIVQMIAEITGK